MLNTRKSAFDSFWLSVPDVRQSNRSATRIAYDLAVHSLSIELGGEEKALKHLQERFTRYVQSPLATKEKRKYCMNPKRWIEERHWEDNDAVWGYVRTRREERPRSVMDELMAAKAEVQAEQAAGKDVSLVEMYKKRIAERK